MQQLSSSKFPLSSSVLDWLLKGDPSVRVVTLTDLLGKTQSDSRVVESEDEVGRSGWAAKIFEKQHEATYWESKESCYVPKWTSCGWVLPVLADLNVSGSDIRVKNAVEHYLSKHCVDGLGFSLAPKGQPGFKSHVCLTGNMVRALAKFGFGKDVRVTKSMEWLVGQQLADGGWNCFSEDGAKHGSFMSTHEPLWALVEMTKVNPRPEWKESARKGSEFLLNHRVFRSDRDDEPVLLEFSEIHYPLHARYDFLHGLRILSELGVEHDPRMDDALNLLYQKRLPDGQWALEGVFRGWRHSVGAHGGRTAARPEERETITKGWGTGHTLQLEEAGKSSQWITLQALLVLKRLGKLESKSL